MKKKRRRKLKIKLKTKRTETKWNGEENEKKDDDNENDVHNTPNWISIVKHYYINCECHISQLTVITVIHAATTTTLYRLLQPKNKKNRSLWVSFSPSFITILLSLSLSIFEESFTIFCVYEIHMNVNFIHSENEYTDHDWGWQWPLGSSNYKMPIAKQKKIKIRKRKKSLVLRSNDNDERRIDRIVIFRIEVNE